MVSQPETPVYDLGVYQWELTDPVQGGIGGIANLPILNLSNRTAYLKQRLDSLANGTLIPPTVAPLNGPAFTGSTTAPNVTPGDNSTLIANTNFVQTAKAGIAVIPLSGSGSVTLTQVQWGVGILVFTGTLTGPMNIIFPTGHTGAWITENSTTGPFALTCKTASGSGHALAASPNQFDAIWTDGSGMYPQISPFLLSLTFANITGGLGFVPVQQGGGSFQGTNKVYIGWDGSGLRGQVDVTDIGRLARETGSNNFIGTNTFVTGPIMANNAVLQGRDTGNTVRNLIGYMSDNWVHQYAGAVGWQLANQAGSLSLMTCDPVGNVAIAQSLNVNSALAVAGAISAGAAINAGGAIASTGNVTANNGRLRATFGSSGDGNAAVILADIASSLTNPGYMLIPTATPGVSLILQWFRNIVSTVNSGGDGVVTMVFPHAFTTNVLGYGYSLVNEATGFNNWTSVANGPTLGSQTVNVHAPGAIAGTQVAVSGFVIGY